MTAAREKRKNLFPYLFFFLSYLFGYIDIDHSYQPSLFFFSKRLSQNPAKPMSELREMSPRPPAAVSRPSLSMRMKSSMIMGITGLISRTFLYGFNKVEVSGLQRFIELVDSREDPEKRQRGLLTGNFYLLSYSFDIRSKNKSYTSTNFTDSLQPCQCVSF